MRPSNSSVKQSSSVPGIEGSVELCADCAEPGKENVTNAFTKLEPLSVKWQ